MSNYPPPSPSDDEQASSSRYASDFRPAATGQSSIPTSTSGRVVEWNAKPLVTYVLLAITIGVFALQFATEQSVGRDLPAIFGVKVNQAILAGQWWRLFTPMFLHGSIFHLGFNMYALYILGLQLERFYGHGRFILLYIIAGFAGNVMSFLMTPAPSLGSSTAIFGLLAAYGVFIYMNKGMFGTRSQSALRNILVIAVINFVIGLSPGIDNWGHLGGFIAGTVFAWIGGPMLAIQGYGINRQLVDIRERSRVLLATVADTVLFSSLLFIGLQ